MLLYQRLSRTSWLLRLSWRRTWFELREMRFFFATLRTFDLVADPVQLLFDSLLGTLQTYEVVA